MVTPLIADCFEKGLKNHPDQGFATYVVEGIREGFDIGFRGPQEDTYSVNLKSAFEHPEVITEYVRKETQAGRIVGPFQTPPFEGFRCSPIGAVPKSDPNKFRIIMNLSAPKGNSINDHIPKDDFSLSYVTVDDAINHILDAGKGTILSKADVEAAFARFLIEE